MPRLLAALALTLSATACGYTWASGADALVGIERLAIDTPRNDGSQPGAAVAVADALRREARNDPATGAIERRRNVANIPRVRGPFSLTFDPPLFPTRSHGRRV